MTSKHEIPQVNPEGLADFAKNFPQTTAQPTAPAASGGLGGTTMFLAFVAVGLGALALLLPSLMKSESLVNQKITAAPPVAIAAPAEVKAPVAAAPAPAPSILAMPSMPNMPSLPSMPNMPNMPTLDGLSSGQVTAIGVGIIGGLVVIDGVLGAPPALAALAGGLAGNWWYGRDQAPATTAAAVTYRQPSSFAVEAAAQAPAFRARWLDK